MATPAANNAVAPDYLMHLIKPTLGRSREAIRQEHTRELDSRDPWIGKAFE